MSKAARALGIARSTHYVKMAQARHDECAALSAESASLPPSKSRGYLCPVIDCFDGTVVSWLIDTRPDAELVNTMLDAAIAPVASSNRRSVVYSDRGGDYRWPGWLSRIAEAKLVRSMSRKACSPDNEACEGFFGRLKNDLLYPRNGLGCCRIGGHRPRHLAPARTGRGNDCR